MNDMRLNDWREMLRIVTPSNSMTVSLVAK